MDIWIYFYIYLFIYVDIKNIIYHIISLLYYSYFSTYEQIEWEYDGTRENSQEYYNLKNLLKNNVRYMSFVRIFIY